MPFTAKTFCNTLSPVRRLGSKQQTESKYASMEWKQPAFPRTRKFMVVFSIGRMMTTVFWNQKGVLLADFLEKRGGATINAAVYRQHWKVYELQSVIVMSC